MKSRLFVLLSAVMVSFVFAVPAVWAAPASLEDATIDVQLWPEGEAGVSVIIVSVRLPESVPLPATVRLPVPDETIVTWAGEVLGGDVSADLQREHEIIDVDGGRAVEFTLETTHTAQYDGTYRVMKTSGDEYSVTLDWVQSVPSKDTAFGVLLPAGVDDIVISPDPPGTPAQNMAGEKLFSLVPVTLEPGDSTQVTVSYRRVLAGSGESSPQFPVLPVLLAALGVAIAALLFAVLRRRDVPAQ